MKLDNKQKYERLHRFLADLKAKPNIQPFLNLEDISRFGIYDFCYITKNPVTFSLIEKNIKDKRYDEVNQFVDDVKKVFLAVADFIFEDDPLQKVCEQFLNDVDRFHQQFAQDFKGYCSENQRLSVNKGGGEVMKNVMMQRQKPAPQVVVEPLKQISLLQKLEMIYLLKANENNEPYIRSIGEHYKIGSENQTEYIITLNNTEQSWLKFIGKGG